MEKAEAPKHRSLHWRYNKTFTICLGVYAKRKSDEIRREGAECGPDWPGESLPRGDCMTDNAIFQSYWMWRKVSTTFIQTIRYTET